jgi:hypothetical protein
VSLALVVFDLLALPGRDVRALPLRERVALMAETLTPMPPAIQPVMATNDKTEARSWYDVLQPQGIEGLVCKALDSPYQPHASARHWLKVRHQDTIDAEFVAFIGTPRRPRTLVLRLADGSQVLTSPQLDPVQARTVAEQLTGLVDDPLTDPALGTVHPLNVPLTAEVLAGSGRHATYRFLRLRTDQ